MLGRVEAGSEQHAAKATRPAAPRSAARSGPLSRTDVLALQRSAGNRAATLVVQRAIVAIDGDTDSDASKRATAACLWNLRTRKGGQAFADGGARGKVAGPAKRLDLPAKLDYLLASDNESIYVLAHGSRSDPSIAGMDPVTMAMWLSAKFSGRNFTGKIKLVSCHSGADRTNQRPGDAEEGVYNFDRSYAQALAVALAHGDTDTFRPSSVMGVVGVGWVDEFTGSITAINKEKYDAAMLKMTTNSDVGAARSTGKTPNPFTEQADPLKRGLALRAVFGDPVNVSVARDDTRNPAARRVGKGLWGKRAFAVGTGAEL